MELICSGRRFKITFMRSHYLQVVGQLPSGQPILNGIEAKLLNSLANAINFTYDLHETEFGQYGSMLPNQSWTGAIGYVFSKKADFALAGLTVTQERGTAIDFSVPYINDAMNFFVGVERTTTRSSMFFLKSFNVNVWLAELACGILVLILMYFISRSSFIHKASGFLLVLGIATRQSINVNSIERPASFVILSWAMTCLILTIFYGNELKAFTTVSTENSIDTLDDLASVFKLENMKLFIPEHSNLVDDIAKISSTPYGDLFRRVSVIRPRRQTDYADIYARRITTAQSGLRMALELLTAGYPPSKVPAVREPLMGINTAIGFQKNFTCQGSFNWIIMALSESGCLQKWQEILMFPVTMEELKDKDSTTTINFIRFADLLTLFGILFAIYFATVQFAIFFELRHKWRKIKNYVTREI